jgi:hypothetical protein
MLTGRGAFIETYNTLLLSGKAFTHDAMRDKYYWDGSEINSSVLAELRGVCAAGRLVAPDQKTLWDAVRALCRKHPCEHVKDQWQDAIAELLNEMATRITIHGVAYWCVALCDIRQALNLGRSAKRIRAIMRELGWQARPIIVY